MAETDQDGAPIIKGVAGKISTLKRRFDYLDEQLEFTDGNQAGFMRSELAALRYGIRALRYHRAILEDMDTPLEVLQQLVDAVGDYPVSAPRTGHESALHAKATAAFDQARQVLKEWT